MKFAWRSTPNSPLSSPGAVPGILPGRGWIASMPRSGSIPTHADLSGREALAALRPAPDPGGLIAIVVIGGGATAVTLVPAPAEDAAPRRHAPAIPLLHPLRPGGGPRRPGDPPMPAGAGRLRAHPLEECPPVDVPLSALPSEARAGKAAPAPRPGRGAAARRRCRYALPAALRALGPGPLLRARRRPVPRDPVRERLDGHRRGGEVHPGRHPARGPAASCRPTSSSRRPA